jgi:hypothetical protein
MTRCCHGARSGAEIPAQRHFCATPWVCRAGLWPSGSGSTTRLAEVARVVTARPGGVPVVSRRGVLKQITTLFGFEGVVFVLAAEKDRLAGAVEKKYRLPGVRAIGISRRSFKLSSKCPDSTRITCSRGSGR